MDKISKTELSAGAALAALMLCCFWRPVLIAAFILAAAVHEAGHILAIMLTGGRIRNVKLEARGMCISYSGGESAAKNILTAAAGPAAGLLGAVLFSLAGEKCCSRFLDISAGASLMLTAFNLLPIMPLDGGMVLRWLLIRAFGEERGERVMLTVSVTLCAAFLLLGAYLTAKGGGIAVLTAAIWLLLSQNETQMQT